MTYITNKEYYLEVARGNVSGQSILHKYGHNSDIDITAEDIWDGGGDANANSIYDFATAAETLYISSSDNGDVVNITVEGLDASWDEQSVTQALVGQTKTEIGSSLTWMRSHRVFNAGSTALAGTVYIYADDTVTAGVPDTPGQIRAIITQGDEQTLMAVYTIPNGKTGFLMNWYASLTGKKDMFATVKMKKREFNGVFRTQEFLELASSGSSYLQHEFDLPDSVPGKTDILITSDSSANNAGVAAGFHILLIDD